MNKVQQKMGSERQPNQPRKTRDVNYDLLRVLSMVGVILLHVSAAWVSGYAFMIKNHEAVSALFCPALAYVFNALPRVAVPCFLMLSGAFLLADDRNGDYKYFYRKSFEKIGIPILVFTALYFFYRLLFLFIGTETLGIQGVRWLCIDVLKGQPMTHMWYVYMLIGIYLMVPAVIILKQNLSEAAFGKGSLVFLILACCSHWSGEDPALQWDIGQSFEYLAYFLMGYVIRRRAKKDNGKGVLLIALGILLEIGIGYTAYHFEFARAMTSLNLREKLVSPYCPLIVVASILVFSGVSMMELKENKVLTKLSQSSFLVYLIHAGVWNFMNKVMNAVKGPEYLYRSMNNLVWIPIFTIVVFFLSLGLSQIYIRISDLLMKKRR